MGSATFFTAACRELPTNCGANSKRVFTKCDGTVGVGTYAPPFRRLNDGEIRDLQQMIRATAPDFFWVGLSTPKQERFMAQYLSILPEAKIFIGVGAAFDLLSGRIRQAPRAMQQVGLEWLFRLSQEPRRLWKRYLINNPLFVLRAGAQLLGLRKYLPVEDSKGSLAPSKNR